MWRKSETLIFFFFFSISLMSNSALACGIRLSRDSFPARLLWATQASCARSTRSQRRCHAVSTRKKARTQSLLWYRFKKSSRRSDDKGTGTGTKTKGLDVVRSDRDGGQGAEACVARLSCADPVIAANKMSALGVRERLTPLSRDRVSHFSCVSFI